MEKIAFCCPIAEIVAPKVLQASLALAVRSAVENIVLTDIGITERELVDQARNRMAEAFLNSGLEWAFWMDSDMVLPPDTLIELMKVAKEKNAKLVSGVYYQRKGKHWPVLWARNPEMEDTSRIVHPTTKGQLDRNKYLGSPIVPHPDKKDPFIVHSAGFGCVLTHRSVFETLDAPWFQFIPKTCSEDFYFFTNAKEAGFDLWAVPGPRLGHIGDAPVIYKEDCYKSLERDGVQLDAIKLQ